MKKEVAIDRRIQKTKKALTEALIRLILSKGYEKVTIQDIIDEANVGRSTFYIHYENKEQLLLDGHNNLNAEIFSIDVKKELSFRNLFDHVAQRRLLAKAMLGNKGGNIMTDFFRKCIAHSIKKNYNRQFGKGKKEQRFLSYLSDAAGAAVISLLVSWLEDDMPVSTEEMASQCQVMLTSIFESFSQSIAR